jgi:Ca2+-binding EF-hand superfamily protein
MVQKTEDSDTPASVKNAFNAFQSDSHEGEYNALVELANRMASEGVQDNMYSAFTIDQVNDRWNRLQGELQERQRDLQAEAKRQQDNEELCKKFAQHATAFNGDCGKLREEMANCRGADIAAQLEDLKHKASKIGHLNDALDKLVALNNNLEEKAIINKHTNLTIETLTLTFNNLNEFAAKQEGLLQKALLSQQGSGVSSEQLQEFKETFKNFDKDDSGSLQKHEFKACMQALGYALNDEQVDKIVNERAKKLPGQMVFEEFVDYMVQKTEDSDTPASVKNAFKTMAGDKDHITEDELRRVLDADTVKYLTSTMPNQGGKFDYNAFTDKTYKG